MKEPLAVCGCFNTMAYMSSLSWYRLLFVVVAGIPFQAFSAEVPLDLLHFLC